MPTDVRSLLPRLQGKTVLVIGDVMLDHYVWGDVERVSAEAPVPVLRVREESERLGAAGNVACNIAALGGIPLLAGLVGRDERAHRLRALLDEAAVEAALVETDHITTTKTRFLAQGQQLLRTDWEGAKPPVAAEEAALLEQVAALLPRAESLVISDYAKGAVTEALMDRLRPCGIPAVIDPRPQNRDLYRGFHLMTPNHKEAALLADTDPAAFPPVEAAAALVPAYTEQIVITCGSRGMLVHSRERSDQLLHTQERPVYDVTGAGDTVAAVLGLALAAQADLLTAAQLANHAAGVVVGKVGTATVTPGELLADLSAPPTSPTPEPL